MAIRARHTYAIDVDLGGGAEAERHIGMEVWEVKEGIKVDKVKPPKDKDEEEEEIEVTEKTIEKEVFLTLGPGIGLFTKKLWKNHLTSLIICKAAPLPLTGIG
jgi:hypothetical protein